MLGLKSLVWILFLQFGYHVYCNVIKHGGNSADVLVFAHSVSSVEYQLIRFCEKDYQLFSFNNSCVAMGTEIQPNFTHWILIKIRSFGHVELGN